MSTNTQLEELQAKADVLGIEYHHRTGVDKLSAQIGAYLMANPAKAGLLLPEGTIQGVEPEKDTPVPVKPNLDYIPLTGDQYKEMSQKDARTKVGALRRIKFTNMNQSKRSWPGEFISVGSSKLGTFKKYIPFNGEPYHVPQIIYDVMKERKCSGFHTVTNGRGDKIQESHLIDEYAIVDLPPLTKAELQKLADKQQLANAGL